MRAIRPRNQIQRKVNRFEGFITRNQKKLLLQMQKELCYIEIKTTEVIIHSYNIQHLYSLYNINKYFIS